MKLLFFVFILIYASIVFAYNSEGCKEKTFWNLDGQAAQTKIAYTILNISTSSGQYISSTGACSSLGMNNKEQKRAFYYSNFDRLKIDVAKGNGEYLEALLRFDDCRPEVGLKFEEDFERYFTGDREKSYRLVNRELIDQCSRKNRSSKN